MSRRPVTLGDLLRMVNELEVGRGRLQVRREHRRDWWRAHGHGPDVVRAPVIVGEAVIDRTLGALATLSGRAAIALASRAVARGPANAPFGRDLARAVIDRLDAGDTLTHVHRFYCGTGLFADGVDGPPYLYAHCEDGLPSRTILAFQTRDEATCWLAAQSDLSLSGAVGPPPLLDWENAGNQRLTRARLEEYAAAPGLRNDPR